MSAREQYLVTVFADGNVTAETIGGPDPFTHPEHARSIEHVGDHANAWSAASSALARVMPEPEDGVS
jgi:hypothetical protein